MVEETYHTAGVKQLRVSILPRSADNWC